MNEPKAFASLSSTLLARKGHAKPAMRPQGFTGFGMATPPAFDDLGWNDMGHEAEPAEAFSADIVPIVPETKAEQVGAEDSAAAPVAIEPPVVVVQQEALARAMRPAPTPGPSKVRAAPGSKAKAAFTLRLDPERHLTLRLVCAVSHRSAQAVVAEALDLFLAAHPAVAELAAKSQSKR